MTPVLGTGSSKSVDYWMAVCRMMWLNGLLTGLLSSTQNHAYLAFDASGREVVVCAGVAFSVLFRAKGSIS